MNSHHFDVDTVIKEQAYSAKHQLYPNLWQYGLLIMYFYPAEYRIALLSILS